MVFLAAETRSAYPRYARPDEALSGHPIFRLMPIPSTQTILLDGFPPTELFRERSWPSEYSPEAWNYANSLALICPRCLRQWAVLAFAGDLDIHPQGAYCEAHGDGRLLLALGPVDWPLLSALPEALARREFYLTLQYLEKEIENGTETERTLCNL